MPRGPISLQETLTRFKICRGLTPNESVSLQEKPPIYDLSTMLGKSLEGNLLGSPLHNLILSSCVRGFSQPHLYDSLILHSLYQVPKFVLWPWRNLLSNLHQGPSLNLLLYSIETKKCLINFIKHLFYWLLLT
jgi:hypothetical protein